MIPMAGSILRVCEKKYLKHQRNLAKFGLTLDIIERSVNRVHSVLDRIDNTLLQESGERLSEVVELANLSAIIGNLYRGAVVRVADGRFAANTPHTYPDLLAKKRGCVDIEIKVALETNKPKGHLVKPGPHLIVRYVLCDENGKFTKGKTSRGKVPWIWEVRIGRLEVDHFSVSNTEGDSGKTAVVTASGMASLEVVYQDLERCPVQRLLKTKPVATASGPLRVFDSL